MTPESKWPQWCRHKTHPAIADEIFNSAEEVPPGWLSLDDGSEINPAHDVGPEVAQPEPKTKKPKPAKPPEPQDEQT